MTSLALKTTFKSAAHAPVVDAVTLEVVRAGLVSIVHEM